MTASHEAVLPAISFDEAMRLCIGPHGKTVRSTTTQVFSFLIRQSIRSVKDPWNSTLLLSSYDFGNPVDRWSAMCHIIEQGGKPFWTTSPRQKGGN